MVCAGVSGDCVSDGGAVGYSCGACCRRFLEALVGIEYDGRDGE